ncbi:MAG: winged helix-turn-helix transcriptional regulator [Pseudolabrys sp.]|nr:winged helix-turn-helix transcriptional regulator [Pseudolabrys sp.]
MLTSAKGREEEQARIMMGLLHSVERDGGRSQRRLASELGIALGLVNAYLRRCIKKGLIKVKQAPVRRYTYYLTPEGFAEKSRLTAEYLASSFHFFRRARSECAELFRAARARGFARVVLVGLSDLAEIAALCALETDVQIVAVVDPRATTRHFLGLPVVTSFATVAEPFDAAIITALSAAGEAWDAAVAQVGSERVLAPDLLGLRAGEQREAAS